MSVEAVMARVAELQSAFGVQPTQPAATPATAAPAGGTGSQFASMLNQAGMGSPVASAASMGSPASMGNVAGVAGVGAPAPGSPGARIVALAEGEVGQAEQPPGSNDSPRIAQYRSATAGAPGPGPWCAYFASWAARGAGVPLGDHGQGFGSVDQLYAWAQSSGRANPVSSGRPPHPGDLIVWNEHVGVVESVDPNGAIHTIEGNSSDRVSKRTYGPDGGGAIGFVSMS